MIDLRNIFVTVLCGQDYQVDWRLVCWLQKHKISPVQIELIPETGRNAAVDKNRWIKNGMMKGGDLLMFAECDIASNPNTDPMLEMPYDITCAQYPVESGDKAWKHETAFHSGLWIARKETLRQLGPPWFEHSTNETQTEITGCTDMQLREKALSKGYTIGHAGKAGHTPRQNWQGKTLWIRT